MSPAIRESPESHPIGGLVLVDLDTFIGKEVILTDARIFAANNEGALVKSGGVAFSISSEGIDRETFRLFLKSCWENPEREPECKGRRLLVTPNGKRVARSIPILINVKLVQ
jgi:hypothetical protein